MHVYSLEIAIIIYVFTIYIECCLFHCLKQPHAIFYDENKQAENTPTGKTYSVTIVTKYIPFQYFTRSTSKTLEWEQVQSRCAMTWNDSTPRLTWE